MKKLLIGLLLLVSFSSYALVQGEALMDRLIERQSIYLDQSSPNNDPKCPGSLSFSPTCKDGSRTCIEVKGESTVWISSESVNQGRDVMRQYSKDNTWSKVTENTVATEHLLKIKTSLLSRDGLLGPLSGFVPLFTTVKYRDKLILQETESGISMSYSRSSKGNPSKKLKCVYQSL